MSDLFKFFAKVNKGDLGYVDKMTDEEVKSISPFVLTMWMNGATSYTMEHTVLTDTYCNDYVFSLSQHPRYLLKLFIAANEGYGDTRYKFKKCIRSEESNITKMISDYFHVNIDTARQYKSLLGEEDIKELKSIYEK